MDELTTELETLEMLRLAEPMWEQAAKLGYSPEQMVLAGLGMSIGTLEAVAPEWDRAGWEPLPTKEDAAESAVKAMHAGPDGVQQLLNALACCLFHAWPAHRRAKEPS
ncbi:hypothetical protein [Candidatus Nitrospira bockiana]